jgi:predicted RNA-binding Zn-ribbon protein involved in translation (DUF1610 family)
MGEFKFTRTGENSIRKTNDTSSFECPKCGEIIPQFETKIQEGFTHPWLVEIWYCPLCGKTLGSSRTRTDKIKERW